MSNKFITRGQFIDFCKLVFGNNYRLANNGRNIEVVCPICKKLKQDDNLTKTKLAIETEKHIVHCWSCGYKSRNLIHLLKNYLPNYLEIYIETYNNSVVLQSQDSEQITEFDDIVTLPNDYRLLALEYNSYNKDLWPYVKYLKERNCYSEQECWYWKYGISNSSNRLTNRIIIPSYDSEGKLNYYVARTLKKNWLPKYTNPYINSEDIIFNEININWNKELTIVEGAFDLIKCNQNATCILGSNLTANYKLFYKIIENKTPVVLALDPDAKHKTLNIAKRLFEFDISIRIINYRNYDNDVGSMLPNQFVSEFLHKAPKFDMTFMLKHKINMLL